MPLMAISAGAPIGSVTFAGMWPNGKPVSTGHGAISRRVSIASTRLYGWRMPAAGSQSVKEPRMIALAVENTGV